MSLLIAPASTLAQTPLGSKILHPTFYNARRVRDPAYMGTESNLKGYGRMSELIMAFGLRRGARLVSLCPCFSPSPFLGTCLRRLINSSIVILLYSSLS